jgi:epimerase transport system membrane fusion protein
VQHLEGGIVREILVREGERVAPGHLLLRLDDTQALAQLEIARSQYLANRALEARLVAERDGYRDVVFPDDLQAAATTRACRRRSRARGKSSRHGRRR